MNKTYIIYYTWPNTASNHAGMRHLVKNLKKKFPNRIRLIEIPKSINKWHIKFRRLHFYLLLIRLKVKLDISDKVLFMEYLGTSSGNQTGLAIKLRQWGVKSKFLGLVHLSSTHLLEIYDNANEINKGVTVLDKILVLGSSLASFFIELGHKDKLITTFHYADNNYYKPTEKPKSEKLQVIHIGSIKRNFTNLREIIIRCPKIDFHICQGLLDLKEYFLNLPNVTLYGFLSEDKLLNLMQTCHVNLNTLDDTVGSNVITTSMACGLVNVVTDVGSIRDYCNSQNSFLCKSTNDYVAALKKINSDRELYGIMSRNSLNYSLNFSIEKSLDFFYQEIIK